LLDVFEPTFYLQTKIKGKNTEYKGFMLAIQNFMH
jgi:hypothetical protein